MSPETKSQINGAARYGCVAVISGIAAALLSWGVLDVGWLDRQQIQAIVDRTVDTMDARIDVVDTRSVRCCDLFGDLAQRLARIEALLDSRQSLTSP